MRDDDSGALTMGCGSVDTKASGFVAVARVATLLRLAAPPLGVRGTKISGFG